jgi:outer membrane protein TolC
VLDSQRSLFDAEISEASATGEHAKSLIRLYKALGGGWPMPKSQQSAPADSAPKKG